MGLFATAPVGIAGPEGAGVLGAGDRIGESKPPFSPRSMTMSSRFLLSAMLVGFGCRRLGTGGG